jgi:alpha,alpha-trehalase
MTTNDSTTRERQRAAGAAPPADLWTPADRYAELFLAVQRDAVFDDCKTFVDCAPTFAPEVILQRYRQQCSRAGFDLRAFVHQHFAPEPLIAKEYVSPEGEPLIRHIDGLWSVLTRQPAEHPAQGSLLPLPQPYVVPGGRFTEQYYWDSYFTMLGLAESGRADLVHSMTENFAYLIDTHGFVPNGNRTYYRSRSQPPVFALMTELCELQRGPQALKYLPQMLREHGFWMEGADTLRPRQTHRRVVALPDGALLNRYWDDRETPREEAWREDVTTAQGSDRPAGEVYRHLRAAAESGWDFSSRWLREPLDGAPSEWSMSTICTTDIVPVDLNAFLHKLETTIARLARAVNDLPLAAAYDARAKKRRAAIDALLWNDAVGAYFDYDLARHTPRRVLCAATVTPLFTGTASARQARAVARTAYQRLLAPGGLATTEHVSGQQWDRPNGWAPLQWMAVRGFERYDLRTLADEIRSRWVKTVGDLYRSQGKVVEKYALRELPGDQTRGGHGGEYPLQDGFGWTNGVTRRWLHEIPDHDVRCARRAG